MIAQEVGEPLPFELNLVGVTPTTFTVNVYPKDEKMSYILMASTRSYLVDNELLGDDQALYQDDIDYFEYLVSSGYSWDEFISSGVQEGLTYNGSPETEYVVYAYGIDANTHELLTEIVYLDVTTEAVQMRDVTFDVNATADGPTINYSVTPVSYNGYYAYDIVGVQALADGGYESMYDYMFDTISYMFQIYGMFGFTTEEALEYVCSTGVSEGSVDADANTDYYVMAVAVSDQGVVDSEASYATVTTGNVEPSDNVITITVSDITARGATVSFTTTNDDPYAVFAEAAGYYDGMTEEEIWEDILSYSYNVINGDYSEDITGLEPSTSYEIFAFGYSGGQNTTELFRTKFTTPEAVESSVSFRMDYPVYYDLDVLGQYDEELASYANSYDALMPATVVTDPVVEEYYYVLMDGSQDFSEYTEDYLRSFLVSNGDSRPTMLYVLDYDQPLVFLGFAVDADGNWGPLWISDVFTLTEAGASPDVQDFLDYWASLASLSSVNNSSSRVSYTVKFPGVPAYSNIMGTRNGAAVAQPAAVENTHKGSLILNTENLKGIEGLTPEMAKRIGSRMSVR